MSNKGFKNLTPDDYRNDARSSMDETCTHLAGAIQAAGLTALLSEATDDEIQKLMAANAINQGEFIRIMEGEILALSRHCLSGYVAAASRALRFDEQETQP